jgi:hypothetical protein
MVTLSALFTGPGGPWAIAYLGVLEDSRDGCGKTVVGQVGCDGMKGKLYLELKITMGKKGIVP